MGDHFGRDGCRADGEWGAWEGRTNQWRFSPMWLRKKQNNHETKKWEANWQDCSLSKRNRSWQTRAPLVWKAKVDPPPRNPFPWIHDKACGYLAALLTMQVFTDTNKPAIWKFLPNFSHALLAADREAGPRVTVLFSVFVLRILAERNGWGTGLLWTNKSADLFWTWCRCSTSTPSFSFSFFKTSLPRPYFLPDHGPKRWVEILIWIVIVPGETMY